MNPDQAQTTALPAEHRRAGMLVANKDLRSPTDLAVDLAGIDALSMGRVEWGMGAGWDEADYSKIGLPFDPGPRRAERLIASIPDMRRVFRDLGHATGGRPGPATTRVGASRRLSSPPLLIGAAEQRLLTFAAAQADIVNLNRSLFAVSILGGPPRKTHEEALSDQVSWVREGAGERFSGIELSLEVNPTVSVTAHRTRAVALAAASSGVSPSELLSDPRTWIGSVEEIAEHLLEVRERFGVSHWVVYEPFFSPVAPVVAALSGR